MPFPFPPVDQLFEIDLEVEDACRAAYGDRLSAIENQKLRLEQVLEGQANEEDAAWLRDFLSDVRTLKSQARRNGSLLQTKSGKQHIKRVETWFKSNIENEIQELENRVRTALLGLVMRDQQEANQTEGPDLGVPTIAQTQQTLTNVPGVALKWEVASVDRATLDLEKLRPYLTEYALKLAAKAHLDENGPNALQGVTYNQTLVN